MPDTETDGQVNFLGGMVTSRADILLSAERGESQLLTNVSLSSKIGAVEQVKGSQYYNHIQGPNSRAQDSDQLIVDSLFRFYKSDGTGQTIAGWTDGATFGLSYFDDSSETLITSSLAATITDYAVYQDVLYMVNGTGTLYIWDGSALTTATFPTLGSAPFAPTIIEMQKGRAYYAGDSDLSSTIIYSLPTTPNTFLSPFTDFATVSDDDGDRLTSLKQFGPNLIAFKERKTYIIEGSPPQRISPLNLVGVGCVDQKTVQKTTFGLIFLGQRGLYLMETVSSVRSISENIRTDLQQITSGVSPQFSSVFHKNIYYLFYKPTTTTTIQHGYSFDLNALLAGSQTPSIAQLRDFQVEDSAVFDGAIDEEEWLGARSGSNTIMQMLKQNAAYYASVSASSADMISKIRTRWFDAGSASREKELYWLYLYFHRPTLQMDVKLWIEHLNQRRTVDVSATEDTTVWGTGVWGTSTWGGNHIFSHQIRVPQGLRYNRISAEITVSGLKDQLTLDGLEWHYLVLPEV